MLQGQEIVYFSNDFHADNRTSSHHVAEQLAKTNRLLYIEAGGSRRPRVSGRDFRRMYEKTAKWMRGPRPETYNTSVATLFLLPFHRSAAARTFNRALVTATVKRSMRVLGLQDPILWVVLPHVGYVIPKIQHKLAVYYCVDDYASMPMVDGASMRDMEAEVLQNVDVAFAVNESVAERLRFEHPDVHHSPHGVDVAHFRRALDPSTSLPDDVARLPRPMVGFFGLIEEWIDLPLLRRIAEEHPQWSVVLIGRAAVDTASIDSLPNVFLLGPRPYGELPAYAKAFDVGILPYVLNGQVINCNPIKLREYLAAGLPTVAVRTREIERYGDVVLIADDREQFVRHVESAVLQRTPELIECRLTAVAAESWEERVGRAMEIVNLRLANTKNMAPTRCHAHSQPEVL